jgi:hypothetical protein
MQTGNPKGSPQTARADVFAALVAAACLLVFLTPILYWLLT